jgi:hypothetical protein
MLHNNVKLCIHRPICIHLQRPPRLRFPTERPPWLEHQTHEGTTWPMSLEMQVLFARQVGRFPRPACEGLRGLVGGSRVTM